MGVLKPIVVDRSLIYATIRRSQYSYTMTVVEEGFSSASGQITVSTEQRGVQIARLRRLGCEVNIGTDSNHYRTVVLIRKPCTGTV